jgi:hypothetical protein
MNVEDTRWFKVVVLMIAFGTVWWLSARVGVWPNGPQSIPSTFLFLFCLLGAERLFGMFLGIVAVALSPGGNRTPPRRYR